MKTLLFPCLVVAVLTVGRVVADDLDLERDESLIVERMPTVNSRSKPAKRSFFEMPKFVISFQDPVFPVSFVDSSAGSSEELEERLDSDLLSRPLRFKPTGGPSGGPSGSPSDISAEKATSSSANRCKLCNKSLTSLRDDGVPEGVLLKLNSLKDKDFENRQALLGELKKILTEDELAKFQEPILKHASSAKRCKLCNKSLASLRTDGVPEGVLLKLNSLKDKDFENRQALLGELEKTLTGDELAKFQEPILKHASSAKMLTRAECLGARSCRNGECEELSESDLMCRPLLFGSLHTSDEPCDMLEGYVAPNCKRPGALTFTPGLRTQAQYRFDDGNSENDFSIRRFRIKGTGRAYDLASYGADMRFDGAERFDQLGPTVGVENAWVDFKLVENQAYFRAGLYDVPFSRSVLTSDSRLLFQDRTITSAALTAIGVADNTVGVMLHGRPCDGQLEYGFGVFDNIRFDRVGKDSKGLMPAGRVAWYFWDSATGGAAAMQPDGWADYRGSYLGMGQRLVVGANVAHERNVEDGPREFDIFAWGCDIAANAGPWVFEAEYSWFAEEMSVGAPDLKGNGWNVQVGYLLNNLFDNCNCWELAARYQDLKDPISPLSGSSRNRWTSIGVNYYFHEHNFKVQGDYTWKNESEAEIDNDTFQVQLQLDF